MVLDLDSYLERLIDKRELLSEKAVHLVCLKLKEVLVQESNVHHISTPVTVVGDVHGQFYDVLEIFRIGGKCPDTNYLFLGDYVDRGYFSVETISLLACLKLRYPSRIHLIRGNHESRAVTKMYGFYNECISKYGSPSVWKFFMEMFDFLTLSVVIDNRIFCTHGGLSPYIQYLDQIRVLYRFQELPHEGPLADLMWSDPEPDKEGFAISPRGAGYTFGYLPVKRFLHLNKMDHILRAHQLCMEGYQVLFDNQLATINQSRNLYFNVFDAAPENARANEEIQAAEKAAKAAETPLVQTQYFL